MTATIQEELECLDHHRQTKSRCNNTQTTNNTQQKTSQGTWKAIGPFEETTKPHESVSDPPPRQQLAQEP
jgi:hypothetical protein